MKMNNITLSSLLVAGVLAGCAAPIAQPSAGTTTLVLTPRIASERTVQGSSGVEPWKQADVTRVVLELYTVANEVETPVLDGGAPVKLELDNHQAFNGQVRFTSLKANTTYRVRAYGYQDTQQITVDASSSLDVPIAYYEYAILEKSIPLQLADKAFAGQASAGLAVSNGTLVASGSETFDFINEVQ
ncbi:hypothetical protein J7643_17160 [bacterium]|nr:hypothetical protein [bacterium]